MNLLRRGTNRSAELDARHRRIAFNRMNTLNIATIWHALGAEDARVDARSEIISILTVAGPRSSRASIALVTRIAVRLTLDTGRLQTFALGTSRARTKESDMRSALIIVAAVALLPAGRCLVAGQGDLQCRHGVSPPTCANCHGTNGVSVGEVASLAGRPKDEIARKMQDFKAGGCRGRSCRSSRRATPTSRSTSSPHGSRRRQRNEEPRRCACSDANS